MLRCYLTNKKSQVKNRLSDVSFEVNDDNEYIITLELAESDVLIQPVVMIGDIAITMKFESELKDGKTIYKSIDGGFFDNALFLNYFGECSLSVFIGETVKNFIIEVNVTGYKANIAKEMLGFLSDNADDILQTCYSKSQTGFSHKEGNDRNFIKMSALTHSIEVIERLLHSFKLDRKSSIEHKLEFNSNKPIIVDDSSASWLSENMDKLEISNSTQSNLRIKRRYYQVPLPNSVTYSNTDFKENRVLHQFVMTALGYLSEVRSKVEEQSRNITEEIEYKEYVKFDQVIKGEMNPILTMRIKTINHLIKRVKRLYLFFKTTIPVKRVTGEMPIQTQYTLRHRHYGVAFNAIATFYKASDADRSNTEFLLGLRNLSQLFEFCCLYYLINYFKQFTKQVSVLQVDHQLEWEGKDTGNINVLANEFVFETEFYKYSLAYEKKFFSLSKNNMHLQNNNLVRLDVQNNTREPDYTIKVLNKVTRDYYFIILDAKFSRSYRMRNKKVDETPSVLQTNFTKYSTNLKTYKDGNVVDLTRYVGILFGLSKSEQEQKRITMFRQIHDIDGIAPISTFSAADFISFSGDRNGFGQILDKYISR
jgi:hypothetical protein